jgi:transposase
MDQNFPLSELAKLFPTNDACLEEIKKLRFPKGIYCTVCRRIMKHYKLQNRMAYTCEGCRKQVYPLSGTIFEKTSTPLRLWFYAMFLMTHTRGTLSAKRLQKELGVTYKTAWRMSKRLHVLMEQNKGDLLRESERVFAFTFFKKLEFKFVEKKNQE